MSRLPLPSRWTLLVELVIVSISPVPKLEPGPVSYIHWESAPEPAAPLKSSLNTVDQPDGGAGTALGAASAPRAVAVARADCAGAAACAAGAAAAEAAGSVAVANAATGAAMVSARLRRPGRHRCLADLTACGVWNEMPGMTSLPTPPLRPELIRRFPI